MKTAWRVTVRGASYIVAAFGAAHAKHLMIKWFARAGSSIVKYTDIRARKAKEFAGWAAKETSEDLFDESKLPRN